ncbi:HTH CenpB-type DNA-binding domain [Sergentomyia squamirostris]
MTSKKGQRSICDVDMLEALKAVVERGETPYKAAKHYNLCRKTLENRANNVRDNIERTGVNDVSLENSFREGDKNSKHGHWQVFSAQQETLLEHYLITRGNMNFGMTTEAIKQLAYEYAVFLGKDIPESWKKIKAAGKHWYIGFMKRHKNTLSLRSPENTSVARCTSFNRENVEVFQKNLDQLMREYSFSPSRIWNLDETGLSSVLRNPKVVAKKGSKQVGKKTSQERGTRITVVGIASADGKYMPPVYIFPQRNMKYLDGAMSGSKALFGKRAWMTNKLFLDTLHHFEKHAKPSKDNPVLLLMDNHSSHTSLEAIKYCRDSGIHLLSFPPHCTHKIQPLDLTVFGPFKEFCSTAYEQWMTENDGELITLDNIVRISAKPLEKSMSERNIQSGFRKCGVHPLNPAELLALIETLEKEDNLTGQADNSGMSADTASVQSHQLNNVDHYFATVELNSDPLTTATENNVMMTMTPPREEYYEQSYMLEEPNSDSFMTAIENNIFMTPPREVFESYMLEEPRSEVFDIEPQQFQEEVSEPQPLDLSSSSSCVGASETRHSQRAVSAIRKELEIRIRKERPLDLSYKTSKIRCGRRCGQLRFGGIEIVRPLPKSMVVRQSNKGTRQMNSAILTSSPEFKKRVERQQKKAEKQTELEQRKAARILKKEARIRQKEELEQKKVAKALQKEKEKETEKEVKRGRGRPKKMK